MKKTFVLIFFAVALFSCSKDESEMSGSITINIKLESSKNVPSNVNYSVGVTPEGSITQISNIKWDRTINYDSKTIQIKSSDIINGVYHVSVSLNYPTTDYTYTYSNIFVIQVLPDEESKMDIDF